MSSVFEYKGLDGNDGKYYKEVGSRSMVQFKPWLSTAGAAASIRAIVEHSSSQIFEDTFDGDQTPPDLEDNQDTYGDCEILPRFGDSNMLDKENQRNARGDVQNNLEVQVGVHLTDSTLVSTAVPVRQVSCKRI